MEVTNQATFMLEAARCIEVLHNERADEVEHANCALAARNILTQLQTEDDFRFSVAFSITKDNK